MAVVVVVVVRRENGDENFFSSPSRLSASADDDDDVLPTGGAGCFVTNGQICKGFKFDSSQWNDSSSSTWLASSS